MSEHLAAAAQKLGAPEELVERSARARAAAQGVDVDTILAAWAGGEAAPAPAAAPAAPPPEPEPSTEAEPAEPPAEPAPAPAAAPAAAAPTPAAAAVITAPPVPDRVTAAEAADYDVVTTVATSGLKERTVGAIPRWLTSLFVILPLAGLTYLVTFSGGPECGTSGQLAVDRMGGVVVGCDGSAIVGGGVAGGGDPREIIAAGSSVYAQCTACHGGGGGGGVGPALSGGAVVATFSSCLDHIEWVRLGTPGFQAAGLATYGDAGKPVGGAGVMPGFASLSEEELSAVVFFERVQFGGQDPTEALTDCGYGEAPAEGGEGETPAEGGEGETPAEGGEGETPAEGGEGETPAEGDAEALADSAS